MPAIDKGDELYRAGSAVSENGIYRCPRRPAGIEHVVDYYDCLIRQIAWDLGACCRGALSLVVEVVALIGYIELSERDALSLKVIEVIAYPARKGNPAPLHPQNTEVGDSVIALGYLVRYTRDCAVKRRAVHYLCLLGHRAVLLTYGVAVV